MLTFIIVRMGFNALRHHKTRTLLTLLGIVIGIAGIITINAVGKGAQKRAREQFLTYGTKSLALHRGNWLFPSQKIPKLLTLSDIEMIKSQCPGVSHISPATYTQGKVSISFLEEKMQTNITGGNEFTHLIDERKLAQGAFFTQEHVQRKENVAVIDSTLVPLFFKQENPIGKIIRIQKTPFIVTGVLAPKTCKGKWDDLGPEPIIIPYTTHMKYFDSKINSIIMNTYYDHQIESVIRQVEKIFRAAHMLEPSEPNDFIIFNTQSFAQEAEKASKSVGLFAFIAALIALVVGGIGVMNVMLIAVKERTKEIGIKMALGATMNIIRLQFLFESVVICMTGGSLGVLVGIALSYGLNYFLGILTVTESGPVIISFLASTLIGLVFGFYPAEQAARLQPVKALTDF